MTSSPEAAAIIRTPHADAVTTHRWPRWLDEMELALPVCAQFVFYGNVRDVQLIPSAAGMVAVPPVQSLWERLSPRGYGFLLVFDRSEGLKVYPREAAAQADQALRQAVPWLQTAPQAQREGPAQECAAARIPELIRAVEACVSTRCALVVENASRLVLSAAQLSESELQIFSACERLARTATPRQPPGASGQALFNPVFWLSSKLHDLPDWFVIGNERIRTISVASPDYEVRRALAEQLAPSIDRNFSAAGPTGAKLLDHFAAQTEGLTLRAIYSVAQLARNQRISLEQIPDAIRCYKVGVPDDPWKKSHLRDRIRDGDKEFRVWVKGQDSAIRKTLDILTRSVMGLSGAQASTAVNRPRGVLFFAGPTGVGKTELAKAVSRLIFGDAQACVRFDMSEFSAEHSDARLIGAPPGYVGYDTGGELVNAIRQRPFSVLLFDEIEKAHPRILDKFLQVLEDGRLTDGRGDTVHFSETVIIFTSNLGIFREDESGQRVLNVSHEAPYAEVEKSVRGAIEDYFRFNLQRPELLNRIGDNIVVFDFIRPEIAEQIFDKALSSVITRVKETNGLEVALVPAARQKLLRLCTVDPSNGGRGIGNRIETSFINPLARALFDLNAPSGSKIEVTDLTENEAGYAVVSCASR
jgi:energy-coupling factor transporter ATP-binding protein EcfA2